MAQPAGLDNVVLIDSGHEPRDRQRGQKAGNLRKRRPIADPCKDARIP